ncbi:unnamed protein product, partial [Heterotrigona itama]
IKWPQRNIYVRAKFEIFMALHYPMVHAAKESKIDTRSQVLHRLVEVFLMEDCNENNILQKFIEPHSIIKEENSKTSSKSNREDISVLIRCASSHV